MINYLRNKAGIKTKMGIINGQRVDYFKGKAAIDAVLSPEYKKHKDLPQVETREQAEKLLHGLLPYAFFLRVERGELANGKETVMMMRPLQVVQMQMFESDMYYAWFYEGSQLWLKLAGLGMVLALLAAVMFPLWPLSMRIGVWYLSMFVLALFGLLMVIAVIRLIIWAITIVVVPPGIWIFPNLFADVGVIESFIPLWAWDEAPPKKEKGKKGKKKAKAGKERAAAHVEEPEPAAEEPEPAPAPAPEEATPSGGKGKGGKGGKAAAAASDFADVN